MLSGVGFDSNIAQDGGNTNQGGAISLKESASLRVQGNVMFANNSVIGKNPNGGAVWISVATEVILSGAIFENNIVRVKAEYGFGGALHIESSKALLDLCRFDSNVALLDDAVSAISATAGGISVWQDAELTVSDTVFSANQAGGIGQNEAKGSGSADARQVVRAAHILSAGTTVARRCKFTSTAPIDLPFKAPWWIVGTGTGRITLLNSAFQGSTTGREEGMLSLTNEVNALLRGCIGSNVKIDSKVAEGRLGIVDSIFSPALGAALQYIAPPMCGTEVAGQRMCDPRAACKLRPSGGVECQCNSEGMGPSAGVRDDGSRCVTIPSLKADVAARFIRFVLPKPGKHTDPIKLHAFATGDEGFNVTYSRSTVMYRDGSAVAQSDDGLHARVFGVEFGWTHSKPTLVVSMALDAAKQRYSATIEHEFTLSLQCTLHATGAPAGNGTTCPQDGDTIETTIFVTPQAGKVSVPSTEVRIVTEVQAAVSCERTKSTVRVVANTDLDNILPTAPLSVHLLAMDIDDQPIRFSRAELVLTWDGIAVPFDWLRGFSEYSWQIPPDRGAGQHEIVVRLQGSNCTLLSLSVTVASDRTQTIVAWSIAGAATLVFALLVWLLFKNRDRAQEFLSSFVTVEGVLTFQIGMEVW